MYILLIKPNYFNYLLKTSKGICKKSIQFYVSGQEV